MDVVFELSVPLAFTFAPVYLVTVTPVPLVQGPGWAVEENVMSAHCCLIYVSGGARYGEGEGVLFYVVKFTVRIAVGDDLNCCVCSIFDFKGRWYYLPLFQSMSTFNGLSYVKLSTFPIQSWPIPFPRR